MRDGLRELPAAARRWVLVVYAAAVLAVVSGLGALPTAGQVRAGVVLAALAAVSAWLEARAGRVHVAAQSRKDLGSVWVISAALLGPALVVAAVAVVAYVALAAAEPRRRNAVRVLFNAATYTVAGTLAHHAFVAVADGTAAAGTPRVLAGMLLAAAVVTVAGAVVVAEVMHRLDPHETRRRLLAGVGWSAEASLASVALLLAVATQTAAVLGVLALPPILLLQRGLLHRQMLAAARTDPKTGLLNHTSWLGMADRVLARGDTTSVLLVDLDHFKAVNDEHGHLVGDQVLVAVAEALARGVRPGDMLGRFGGEEFAVLLPRADAATAGVVGERLRRAVAEASVATPSGPLRVTASVGAATATGSVGPERLLAAADAALYVAKRAGRDRLSHAPGPLTVGGEGPGSRGRATARA